jgi:hypothetical protein
VTADEYLALRGELGRVAPQPPHWNRIWQLLRRAEAPLPGRRSEPLPPLIVAASSASDWQKVARFAHHLRDAEAQGVWPQIRAQLEQLAERDWEHGVD